MMQESNSGGQSELDHSEMQYQTTDLGQASPQWSSQSISFIHKKLYEWGQLVHLVVGRLIQDDREIAAELSNGFSSRFYQRMIWVVIL
ncbi:hypothetical protein, partial, partial [Parasitella parasitica]